MQSNQSTITSNALEPSASSAPTPDIPTEQWSDIISYLSDPKDLSSIVMTSRALRIAARTAAPTIFIEGMLSRYAFLQSWFACYFPLCRSLRINRCFSLRKESLKWLMHSTRDLQRYDLVFSSCIALDEGILECLPISRRLSISKINITRAPQCLLDCRCEGLEILNIVDSELTLEALTGLLTHLPKTLRILGLGGCCVRGDLAQIGDLLQTIVLESCSNLYIDTTGFQLHNGSALQDTFNFSTPVRFLNFLEDSYDDLDSFVRIVPYDHLQCMLSSGDGRQSILHIAARNDRADKVSWLLANGASYATVDHKGFTSLHRAIEGSCRSATLAFFEYFSRIADSSHIQPILQVLFRKNHMQETPLFSASLKGDSSVLRMIINLISLFSAERDAFLEGMCHKGGAATGAAVNIASVIDHINKDDKNFSLAHAAVLRQSSECLEILLRDYKISANSFNTHKHTPLHLAYRSKNQELVELLLRYGADSSLVSAKELRAMTSGRTFCRRNRLATR